MKINTVKNLALVLALIPQGCGPADKADKKDDDTAGGDEELGGEAPEDSTGAQGKVTLAFGTLAGSDDTTLWLDGETTATDTGTSTTTDTGTSTTTDTATDTAATTEAAPTTLKVNDTLSLSLAKFNIAMIKVKAKKDPSEKEAENEKTEQTEDKQEADEVESVAQASLDAMAKEKEDGDKDGDKGGKPDGDGPKLGKGDEHKGKRDAIHGKKEELAKKSHEHEDNQAKRDHGTRFKGPYIYDAIAGKIVGDQPQVDLVDGSYRRVEFKLKRNLTAEQDDPLLGNSFVIQGLVKKDGTDVPFEIECHIAMNFRLRGDGVLAVAAGENKLAIVFDVAKWFDGIDLTTAEVDATDGKIYVDKNTNQAILHALKKNIKTATRFGKDKDGDGKLKADETAGKGEDTTDAE